MPLDEAVLREAQETLAGAREELLACRNSAGYWSGELASSALATATATFALQMVRRSKNSRAPTDDEQDTLIHRGLDWLIRTQHADGGWGDTVESQCNISTTALCWATLSIANDQPHYEATLAGASSWLTRAAGGLEPQQLSDAIIRRYGKDRTFSVPILSVLAMAGCLGAEPEAWRLVPQLPFELAAFPRKWFRWLRIPVVSYALPALIAIGQLRHHRLPSRNLMARLLRRVAIRRTLKILAEIQPIGGGFLEATPLTSFVVASLVGAGQSQHSVVHRGVEFLTASIRPDGSWPIDTNLATWVTTLSTIALSKDGPIELLADDGREAIRNWLLGQQYRCRHPYTDAAPGGWSWTDLPGGVPDADDTPGALLALRHLSPDDPRVRAAAAAATHWLLDLQNRDGGMPTFCRGWGRLPFDRSGADLTAHALLAWFAWRSDLPANLRPRIDTAIRRAVQYLLEVQQPDGAWTPLWFGNEDAPNEENHVYGTSRVLRLIQVSELLDIGGPRWIAALKRATAWLVAAQNSDGGWGGAAGTRSSIEETALALEALAEVVRANHSTTVATNDSDKLIAALGRGVHWLAEHTQRGGHFPASPIGFYFAKLWYFEKLYPLIYTVQALSAVQTALALPAGTVRD